MTNIKIRALVSKLNKPNVGRFLRHGVYIHSGTSMSRESTTVKPVAQLSQRDRATLKSVEILSAAAQLYEKVTFD